MRKKDVVKVVLKREYDVFDDKYIQKAAEGYLKYLNLIKNFDEKNKQNHYVKIEEL